MREILFKAKRLNNGKWVKGFYQNRYEVNEEIEHLIFCRKGYNVWEYAEIDPETLCQYTGMNDKNGNRIWENDIVSINTYDYMEPQEDFFGQIIYAEGWGCWCIQQPGDEKPIPLCECEGSYLTERIVEGNVFDNTELLKGE